MSKALTIGVLVAVAAVGAWFVWKPDAKPRLAPTDDGVERETATEVRTQAELAAGPASARADRPKGARATGASQCSGLVRRGGVPVAARVEAHWLMAADANPFTGRRAGFFQRLLDAPPAERDASGSADAGDDGRYVVEGLAAGIYEVRAMARDGSRGATMTTVVADGARVEADIDVEAGTESLAGRVVRADGTAWSGIVLIERGSGASRNFVAGLLGAAATTRADASGAFEAHGLKAGDVTVTAIEPGVFRVQSVPVRVPATAPFVLTIDAALQILKGRVVADADGAPIAGATIAGGGQGGGYTVYMGQTTSGPDGAFEFRVPPGRQSGAMVTAEGFAPGMWRGRDGKEGAPVEVRLTKSARVVGRVTRPGGEPVVGASVRAVSLGDRNFLGGAESTLAGADGRFELADVTPGDVMVIAEAKGLVTKGVADVSGQGYNPLATPIKPGETTTVDVEMVPGARATGTVTDSGGTPVRGAVVTATLTDSRQGGVRLDGSAGGPTAVTGADGGFSLDPLVPSKAYAFAAECAGFASTKPEVVTATESSPLVVVLRFASIRMAEISVLDDATGTGVVGARVTAQGTSGRREGMMGASPTWVTGDDGRTRIGPLEAGDLRIDASADDYVRGQGESPPMLTEGAASLVLRLKRGLPIAGRILLPDASPAVGARVQVEWDGRRSRGWVQPVTTGADGTFRLRGVAPGSERLVVNHSQDGAAYTGLATVTVGAEDVVITLTASGKGASVPKGSNALVVRVLDAEGKPVARAYARHTSTEGGSSGTSVTDGNVTFSLENRAGTLEVWGATTSAGVSLRLAPSRRAIAAGETEVEIRLVPGLSIEGTIRGPDGRGLKGVQVSAAPGARDPNEGYFDRGSWGAYGTARSDASGAFRLDGLGDADYVLSLRAPAEFVPYDGPPVRGGTKGVDITLAAGVSALVTVSDDGGKPVVGASVSVVELVGAGGADSEGVREVRRAPLSTDAAGSARVVGLRAGASFRLDVQAAESLSWSKSPWAPADTVVRVERAFTVSGVVNDQAGRPVASAMVEWSKDKSNWNGTSAGADGRFRLNGIPAGEIYLRTTVGGRAPVAERDFVRVRAGARDVALVLDIGLTLTVTFENWPSDAPRWPRPMLTIEGPGTAPRPFEGVPVDSVSAEGVAVYRDLRGDETYRLAVSLPGGLCALATGIKAGAGVRVRLVPGKTIAGRVAVPPGAIRVSVQARAHGLWTQGKVDADGRYTIEGLPDGTYDVSASCVRDGTNWNASGSVEAGGTLDLEPKKHE